MYIMQFFFIFLFNKYIQNNIFEDYSIVIISNNSTQRKIKLNYYFANNFLIFLVVLIH